jgi:hypothetical protein
LTVNSRVMLVGTPRSGVLMRLMDVEAVEVVAAGDEVAGATASLATEAFCVPLQAARRRDAKIVVMVVFMLITFPRVCCRS